jgi:signal transduction histidine kinase/CheY-like chemotaxis protein
MGSRVVGLVAILIMLQAAALLVGIVIAPGHSPSFHALWGGAELALLISLGYVLLRRHHMEQQDRARLVETVRRRQAQVETLWRTLLASSSGDLRRGLGRLLAQLCRHLGLESGWVIRRPMGSRSAILAGGYHLPDVVAAQPEHFIPEVYALLETAGAAGPGRSPGLTICSTPHLAEAGLPPRVIVLPLIVDDLLMGLVVFSVHERFASLHEAHQRFLVEVAEGIAIVLQRAEGDDAIRQLAASLEVRVRQRTFELQVLNDLSHVLGRALNYPKAMDLLMEHLPWVMSYDVVASLLISPGSSQPVVHLKALRPMGPELRTEIVRTLYGFGMDDGVGATLGESETLPVVEAAPPDPTAPPIQALRSHLLVPVRGLDGVTLAGAFYVGAEPSGAFSPEQTDLFSRVVRRAEESIRQLRSLLDTEQLRLDQLVSSLPEGVVLLDAAHRLRLVNPVAQTYLAQLTPSSEVLISLGGRDLAEILGEAAGGATVELATLGDPVRTFTLRTSGIATGPEAGGCVMLLRDVTEERMTQQRVAEHGRLAAVGQLAAGIAHDFNNVLTGIIGLSELMLLDRSLGYEHQEDLATIRDMGKRAAQMIVQILDFSRQTSTPLPAADLSRALRKTERLLEQTLPESIRLEIHAAPGLYPVRANTAELQQTIVNLAVNARDAMPQGGALVLSLTRETFTAATAPFPGMDQGEWAALRVTDTGVGMPPEVVRRVFEPFFTTKAVGKGTGLGLAQVYGIVERHGGHIDIQSQVGHGTTFTLWLRIERQGTKSSSGQFAQIPRTQSRGLVHLVEDDPETRDVMRRMVQELGFEVTTSTNGIEALSALEKLGPRVNVLLTDLTMPEMGGVELIRQVRLTCGDLPIVVISGYPVDELQRDQSLAEVAAWLSKPLSMKSLSEVLERVLGARSGKRSGLPPGR